MPLNTVKSKTAESLEHKQIRKTARKHGQEVFKRLVGLLDSKDERLVLAVAQEILNRAYGKPDSSRDNRDDDSGSTVIVIRDKQESAPEKASPLPGGQAKKPRKAPASPARARPRNPTAENLNAAG